MSGAEWVLRFEYSANPIPMNGSHGSPFAHAKKVAKVRAATRHEGDLVGVPALGRAEVQLTWFVRRDLRTRDEDNLAAVAKPMYDALVDLGVTLDDDREQMTKLAPRIEIVDPTEHARSWMELRIRPLPLDAAEQAALMPTIPGEHLAAADAIAHEHGAFLRPRELRLVALVLAYPHFPFSIIGSPPKERAHLGPIIATALERRSAS